MKTKTCLYPQLNYLPRTAIVREQKQFIKITFVVHLSAVISAERYRSDSGALKSAVFNFVFFIMLKNKIEQSAKRKLLLNNPTDRTFENRRSRYKELGKKVPQAYRVYVEETFLPCDAGDARIFSKEVTHTNNSGDNEEQKAKRYYYHSDHLGSAQFVTDWKGRQYEHIEYTPYGELWTYKSKTAMLFLTTYNNFLAKQPAGLIEEVAAGLDKLPFRFTGKELDEETGLYYYGARYLDPKYSRWLSGDPALNDYIPKAPIDDEAKKHNENLPGMGGGYSTINLHVYHYAGNNPVKYIDPDGKFHFAKRNLDGAPWLGIFSNNPLDDLFNTEISHEHGFFDDGTGDNIGYFGLDGHVDWNSEDENNFQYSDSIYYDDDLMRKAIEEVGPKKNKYKLFFFGKIGPGDKKFNCQDYCDAIRKKYNELFNQLSPEEQKNILEEKKRIEDKWKKDKEKEAAFQQKLELGL